MMLTLIFLLFFISQEKGDLYIIDISSPKYKPVKIQFLPKDKGSKEVLKIILRNLRIIGYFEIVDKNADILVEISKTQNGFGFTAKIGDKDFFKAEVKSENFKDTANAFSNYIIRKVAGVDADIFGRTLFVLSNLDGKKEIYRMSFISDKLEKIVSAKSFIPAFSVSPSGDKIAYTHYDGRNYRLYITDLDSRRIYSPLIRNGMFISPNFVSEDDLLVSWNSGKGANIYLFSIAERTFTKITNGRSDISAKSFPDGRKIIVSARGGLPQIYVKNGDKIERLPLSGKYNSSPDISPDGKRIVFSKLEGSRFNLYIYDFETKTEKPLVVDFGSSENPTWSKDGNFVLFSSNYDGDYDIYITDRFGNFIKKVFDTSKDEFQAILR